MPGSRGMLLPGLSPRALRASGEVAFSLRAAPGPHSYSGPSQLHLHPKPGPSAPGMPRLRQTGTALPTHRDSCLWPHTPLACPPCPQSATGDCPSPAPPHPATRHLPTPPCSPVPRLSYRPPQHRLWGPLLSEPWSDAHPTQCAPLFHLTPFLSGLLQLLGSLGDMFGEV